MTTVSTGCRNLVPVEARLEHKEGSDFLLKYPEISEELDGVHYPRQWFLCVLKVAGKGAPELEKLPRVPLSTFVPTTISLLTPFVTANGGRIFCSLRHSPGFPALTPTLIG